MSKPKSKTKAKPKTPQPRYAVILATEPCWGTSPDYRYLLGPEALEAAARLRREGEAALIAREDPQGVPPQEVERLGLPHKARVRQRDKRTGKFWY